MAINRKIFFQEIAKAPFRSTGRKFGAAQKEAIGNILDEWEKTPNPGDLEGLAYVIASPFHETGGRMQPIIETTQPNEATPPSVDVAIARLENAFARGQLYWVKSPYWRKDADGISWLGRGGVQNTHKANMVKLAKRFGVPLDKDPDLILKDPVLDARITVWGHIEGIWTGKKLDHYRGKPYKEWRPIVNADKNVAVPGKPGVTYGEMIGGYAYDIGAALNKASSAIFAPTAPEKLPEPTVVFRQPRQEDEPRAEPIAPAITPAVSEQEALRNRVKAVQGHLQRVGLKPGVIDGLMGQNTIGAIAAFRSAMGIAGVPDQIDTALESKLEETPADHFKPAPERQASTPEQAEAKSKTVEDVSFSARIRRRFTDILTALGLGGLADYQTDAFGFFSGRWSSITSTLGMVPWYVWAIVILVGYIAYREYARRTTEGVVVKAFKDGDIIGGDKAPPPAS